jgi:hypothetical protein
LLVRVEDQIIEVQRRVAEAEAGQLSVEELLAGNDEIVLPGHQLDKVGFVVAVYKKVRPLEAAASMLRGQKNPRVIKCYVCLCVHERQKIIDAIDSVEHTDPENSWIEYAKFNMLKDLKWALRIIDEDIPSWGY